jgi:Tol biopolymer transport system component
MHSIQHRRRARALASRLALVLSIGSLAACADQAPPSAPAAPNAASLGVNNGGNNRRILFDRDGAIYSMNPDGTGVSQITFPDVANLQADFSPAWSPDGKQIAFVRMDVAVDGAGEIYIMNADGSGLTRLTASPGNDLSPTWSKDGKRIAFVSSRGDASPSTAGSQAWDIYVMDATPGGTVVRVTDRFGADFDPSWSPDGKQIVFVSGRDDDGTGTTDLYAVTVDGLQVTRLTNQGVQVGEPSWAPGGKQIAFTGGNFEANDTDVYVLTLDGMQLTRITDGPGSPGSDGSPTWSPDGKQIAFTSTRAGDAREIFTMNADGRAVTRLTFNGMEDRNPAWNR